MKREDRGNQIKADLFSRANLINGKYEAGNLGLEPIDLTGIDNRNVRTLEKLRKKADLADKMIAVAESQGKDTSDLAVMKKLGEEINSVGVPNISDIPPEIVEKIIEIKHSQFIDSKNVAVRGIKREVGGKEKAKEYVERVFAYEKAYFAVNKDELRERAISEMGYGVLFIIVTVAVAVITKGQYTVLIWVPGAGIVYFSLGLAKFIRSR